jgi:RHS repeat-associated protein
VKRIQKNQTFALLIVLLVFLMPLTYAETFSFTYDDNGNLINSQYFSYEYNSFNQLDKVYDSVGNLIEEYIYDHEGNRIKKIEYFFDGTNETTYYPFKEMTRKVNDNGVEDTYYYFFDGQTIARDNPDGSRYYYHNDHLGSHSVVTDENGDIVEETEYLPFGAVLSGGDADFLYTGKELDSVGTYYYGARYMDPTLRQFTQPDTVIPDVYNPQSLNRYSYVLNNPYKYVDPTGHFPIPYQIFPYVLLAINAAADLAFKKTLKFAWDTTIEAIEDYKESQEAITELNKEQGTTVPGEFVCELDINDGSNSASKEFQYSSTNPMSSSSNSGNSYSLEDTTGSSSLTSSFHNAENTPDNYLEEEN